MTVNHQLDADHSLQDSLLYYAAERDPQKFVDSFDQLVAFVDASLDLYRVGVSTEISAQSDHCLLSIRLQWQLAGGSLHSLSAVCHSQHPLVLSLRIPQQLSRDDGVPALWPSLWMPAAVSMFLACATPGQQHSAVCAQPLFHAPNILCTSLHAPTPPVPCPLISALFVLQPELQRVLYPVFVHVYLQLVSYGASQKAADLLQKYR